MSWNTRHALLLILVVLGCTGWMLGASQNAVIYGTVYNVASNPMPDVTVVLENKALGITRTTVTGSDGSYTFTEVPPADNYSVTAKQGGRTLDQRTGVTVNVGDERVILPPLTEQPVVAAGAPGGAKPAPQPTRGAPTVRNETITTAISGVVTGDQLRALPLYNRNFLVLGLITPNVHDAEQGSPLTGASFSVAGGRTTENNFLLDGSDNLASSSNQAIPFQVNDSIQEFRVISGTANAEYGRNLSGTVNVVTKRAVNSFHGSAYGYFANEALNADTPLSVYNGGTFDQAAAYAGSSTVSPQASGSLAYYTPFSYNQFVANAQSQGFCTDSIGSGAAGSVPCANGGMGLNTRFEPAVILKNHNSFSQPFDSKQFGASGGGALVKDKLFVFGSYEGTLIENRNPVLERVPSSFDKADHGYGFASGLGTADPNYALAQNILSLYPASTINQLGSGAVPGVLEFYQGETPNYTHVHNFLFRTDYVKSEKTTVSLRYVAQFLKQLHDDTLPQVGAYPGNGAFRDAVNQNASLALSHSFTPKLINELRLGYSRFDIGESPQDASFDATTLGLPSKQMPTILLSGIDTQSSGAAPGTLGAFGPWLDVSGGTATMFPWADGRFPFTRLGAPLGAPGERRDSTFSVSDSVSWSIGRHSFKFGGEFRHLDNDFSNGAFNRGFIYSGNIGEFTNDSESCNIDINFFGACFGNAFMRPSFDFAQSNPWYSGKFSSYVIAGYAQDTWRIHKNVTLNYGLRYEYFSVPYEINNNIWNFDPTANGLVQQNGTGIVDAYGNSCSATNPLWGVIDPYLNYLFGGLPVDNWATTAQAPYSTAGCAAAGSGGYNKIADSNKKNFAPRVGIAWNVRGDAVARPTVVRAGFGMFYDQTPLSYFSQMLYNKPLGAPNSVLGQHFLGTDLAASAICVGNGGGTGASQCGLGNTIIDPSVQTSVAPVNPFSFLPPPAGATWSFYSAMTQPFAVSARDTAHSGTPWAYQASFTVQQQISSKLTTEVGYVYTHARSLPVIYDQNYANEWGHVQFLGTGPAISSVMQDNMSQVPVYTMTNRGKSSYHGLMARARLLGWHGLRVNGTYSWSKSLDNSSTGVFPTLPMSPRGMLLSGQYFANSSYPAAVILFGNTDILGFPLPGAAQSASLVFPNLDFSPGALTTTGARPVLVTPYLIPQDPFNFLVNDYGRSDFDTKHRFTLDYVWETKSSSKWWDDWSFSGIFTAQSGQPFSIFGGPIAGAIDQRAELGVPAGDIVITDNPNGAIDPSQFIFVLNSTVCPSFIPANNASTFMPAPGVACTGRSGRNAFIGPKYINLNVGIQKGFTIFGEGKKLYLRAELFNLLDRANYYNPISSISDNGVSESGAFGQIKSAHDPRQIQLAVRFSW
ncbi:MAG TPA: TonB-dependent receptor [Terriglobales bacterium]|nr:TonB-dependent receptor [Terriglobales bacterium]